MSREAYFGISILAGFLAVGALEADNFIFCIVFLVSSIVSCVKGIKS
jgi:hypothetical protein